MIPQTTLAAVSDGHGHTEVYELPVPRGGSLLRVESSAICGTDVELHEGRLPAPAVLGHHVIGRVERITDADAAVLGLKIGDRVALEEYVGCGTCPECRAGRHRLCPAVDLWTGGERVGMIPADRGSGLHGGNAQYLELTARHAVHRLPDDLAPDLAAWTLPLANAVDWTLDHGGVRTGSKVAIIGPGYHGISCVAAAQSVGASAVHVLGLPQDAKRLQLATALGAHAHVNANGVVEGILAASGPLDVVVDTIGSAATVATAMRLLGQLGVLVLAGLSGGLDGATIDPTPVVRNLLTVRGVRGRCPDAVRRAIEILAAGTVALEVVPTQRVPLDQVERTLHALGEGPGAAQRAESPHVVIDPGLPVAPTAVRTSQEALR